MEDSGRYQELPHRERHFRKNVHAFVAAMDGAVSETGVEKFSSEVILLGSRFILRFLKSIVSDHNEEEFQCMRERECVRVESSTCMKISEVYLYVLSHCKGVAFFSGLRCDKISRRIIISLPVPTTFPPTPLYRTDRKQSMTARNCSSQAPCISAPLFCLLTTQLEYALMTSGHVTCIRWNIAVVWFGGHTPK